MLNRIAVLGVLAFVAGATSVKASEMDLLREQQIVGTPVLEEVPVTQLMEIPTEIPGGIGSGTCDAKSRRNRGTDIIDDIDKIINIGKKVWEIIDAGQPVLDLKVDVATALPLGAKCWNDLERWSRPAAKQYRVTYKNVYGVDGIRYEFQIQWLAGGRVDGQGRFIGYAAVIPVNVYAMWGLKLASKNTVASVFNVGTKSDPIGAMHMTMNWRVKAPFQKFEQALTFYIDGAGNFELIKTEDITPK
jgi:hypothetical protein